MPPASRVSRKFWAVMVRGALALMAGTGNPYPPQPQRTVAALLRKAILTQRVRAPNVPNSLGACTETIYKLDLISESVAAARTTLAEGVSR
jgi:hypothetical protein